MVPQHPQRIRVAGASWINKGKSRAELRRLCGGRDGPSGGEGAAPAGLRGGGGPHWRGGQRRLAPPAAWLAAGRARRGRPFGRALTGRGPLQCR